MMVTLKKHTSLHLWQSFSANSRIGELRFDRRTSLFLILIQTRRHDKVLGFEWPSSYLYKCCNRSSIGGVIGTGLFLVYTVVLIYWMYSNQPCILGYCNSATEWWPSWPSLGLHCCWNYLLQRHGWLHSFSFLSIIQPFAPSDILRGDDCVLAYTWVSILLIL